MNRTRVTLLAACVAVSFPGLSSAEEHYTWSGASGSAWTDSGNWTPAGGPPAGNDTATFAGGVQPVVDLGGGSRSVGAITFGGGAATAFSLSNGTLNLAADGTIAKASAPGAFTQTISAGLTLGGNASIVNNDGPTDMNNPVGDRRLNLTGPISGGGTLTLGGVSSSGIELSGNNAGFTGAVQIDSGITVIGSANALGSTATGTTINGGQIWFRNTGSGAENFTIAGDSQWRSYNGHTQSGNITVNNNVTWNIHNGGGNDLRLSGVVSGPGNIRFEFANTEFTGSQSNTLGGKITQASTSGNAAFSTLYLNKTGGATAVAGDLELRNLAIVQWRANHQIADTSAITLGGGTLNLNGHQETVGTLTVSGDANIDLPGTGNLLKFADSSALAWSQGQVIVRNWDDAGADGVFVGTSAASLTAGQLAKVGFKNPGGRTPGLYRAVLGGDGQLSPNQTRVTPVNAPYDLSDAAIAARAALYTSSGRANLTAAGTPLAAGSSITFFGDSITWLNGYVSKINQAVQSGAGTTGKNIALHNRGINGGGVLQVLNGSNSNTVNGQPQASFAEVLASDQSDVAVVFIGINDVRFLGTSALTFETGLRDIAAAAQTKGTKLVFATPTVSYERPDGTNQYDTQIDQFSQIMRDVAGDTGATLVDLRSAYVAYLQNNNYELRLDGSLTFQNQGLLTYDGLHPTELGQNLLADLISQGIRNAVAVPEPGAGLLVVPAVALLARRRGNHGQ